jgi:thioredoxin reductase
MELKLYDVLIIGGSYAGLQAAMTLARCMRDVLIIDNEEPSNRFAPQAHNLITYDDTEPDKIRRWAREQVLTYPTVSIQKGKIISVKKDSDIFIATSEQGDNYIAKKLLLATGLKDVFPDIEEFETCWGRSVVHCPYCHGYEIRGKELGLMTNANATKEFLPLVYNWSEKLMLFINDNEELPDETKEFLKDKKIKVTNATIISLLHEDGYIQTVITDDNKEHHLDALFVSLPSIQQTDIIEQLGVKLDENGFIDTNIVGCTNIPGVFAAGDCTTPMRAIAIAIAAGYKAGIGINNELVKGI